MVYQKQNIILLLFTIILAAFVGFLVSIKPYESLIIAVTLFLLTIGIIFILINKDRALSLFSLMIILSLLLIPAFSLGELELRLEDFLVIFLTIGLIYTWLSKGKTNILPHSIYLSLIIYLIYSVLITFIQMSVNGTHPIYLLFFLREIQYFIYFFVFCYLATNLDGFIKKAQKVFLFVSVITIFWGIYQLVTNNIIGYYGIGIISTPTASQSGIAFFIITFMLFYLSTTADKNWQKFLTTCFGLLAAVLTVTTVTRTSIVVLGVFLLLYIFFSLFRRKWNFIKIYFIMFAGIIIIPIGYFLSGRLFTFMLERFSRFRLGMEGRMTIWDGYLNNTDILGQLFGNGKGYMQVIIGSFVLKADNQYVRLIVEIGYIGLILWLIFIGSIIIFSIKNFKNNYTDSMFLLIFTICFLIIGLTQEAYMVTIQASLYWIITGFFVGKLIRNKSQSKQTIT